MVATWRRLAAALSDRAPLAKLRPPASAAAIRDRETLLAAPLPADFVASLAIHDGQEDKPALTFLPGGLRLGSLASIARCFREDRPSFDAADPDGRFEWLSKDERVRQVHFHPRHVPIAGTRFWDHGRLLLDGIPGPAGTLGQVIVRQEGEFCALVPSFAELLHRTAEGLERGTLILEPTEHGPIAPRYMASRRRKPIPPHRFFAR